MSDEGAGSETLVGRVESRVTGAGSKSEMTSVVLVPDPPDPGAGPGVDAREVVLRRRHAAALDAEPALLAFVGRRVRVVGRRGWEVFLVDGIKEADQG